MLPSGVRGLSSTTRRIELVSDGKGVNKVPHCFVGILDLGFLSLVWLSASLVEPMFVGLLLFLYSKSLVSNARVYGGPDDVTPSFVTCKNRKYLKRKKQISVGSSPISRKK